MTDPVTFRYHPDPVATGSFEPASGPCPYCGVARGYVYTGPVYAIEEPDPPCPVCVADGSFAARFEAEFTDPDPLSDLADEIVDEVTRRTPGYAGWQQEQWKTHCDDAAAFLGPVGYQELLAHPEQLAWLRDDMGGDDAVRRLSKDGSPTAYLFRCLHCSVELVDWDVD